MRPGMPGWIQRIPRCGHACTRLNCGIQGCWSRSWSRQPSNRIQSGNFASYLARRAWLWRAARRLHACAYRGTGRAMSPPPVPTPPSSAFAAYRRGLQATWTSVFSYVLFGTYIGIGALGHDFGFSLTWSMLCTLLVCAGPAQVVLISSLGAGATVLAAGIAVCISSVRLLPMVVALLP